MNSVRNLRRLVQAPLLNQYPPRLVSSRQLPAPISTFMRHIGHASERLAPPKNWGIRIVPEGMALIIERSGKYKKKLTPGFHVLIPVLDKIAYAYSLKECPIPIREYSVITKENVEVLIGGELWVKIVDPVMASYAVDNPFASVERLTRIILARHMDNMTLDQARREFHKTDQTFKDRGTLDEKIVKTINEEAKNWGLECVNCEMKVRSLPLRWYEIMAKKVSLLVKIGSPLLRLGMFLWEIFFSFHQVDKKIRR